jgi:hypothetical protein
MRLYFSFLFSEYRINSSLTIFNRVGFAVETECQKMKIQASQVHMGKYTDLSVYSRYGNSIGFWESKVNIFKRF